MIVLDASVLIGHFDDQDDHHPRARKLLLEIATEPLGASTITLAEILVMPTRENRLQAATAALDRIGVSELPLSRDASRRLAQLRVESGRKMPDCCVLLAAIESSGKLASFDQGLIKAARRLGLETVA